MTLNGMQWFNFGCIVGSAFLIMIGFDTPFLYGWLAGNIISLVILSAVRFVKEMSL